MLYIHKTAISFVMSIEKKLLGIHKAIQFPEYETKNENQVCGNFELMTLEHDKCLQSFNISYSCLNLQQNYVQVYSFL